MTRVARCEPLRDGKMPVAVTLLLVVLLVL